MCGLNNYARRFVVCFSNSAVIDQFVRQIEGDPPNGSLFSDLLWTAEAAQLQFPAGPDWMEGWMYVGGGVGKFGAKKRIALCTTCKRVPSIELMYFKNNHNFNFLVFITFFCLAFI